MMKMSDRRKKRTSYTYKHGYGFLTVMTENLISVSDVKIVFPGIEDGVIKILWKFYFHFHFCNFGY